MNHLTQADITYLKDSLGPSGDKIPDSSLPPLASLAPHRRRQLDKLLAHLKLDSAGLLVTIKDDKVVVPGEMPSMVTSKSSSMLTTSAMASSSMDQA